MKKAMRASSKAAESARDVAAGTLGTEIALE
jgi:hypothetical protein